MASLVWDSAKGGRRARILFLVSDRRLTVRLGKVPAKVADTWKRRVEELVANLVGGVAPDANLSTWLRALPDDAHGKLSRAGLVAVRVREEKPVRTVESLCCAFKDRAVVKPSTRLAYQQTLTSIVTFFGENRDVSTITTEDADEWRVAISTAAAGEGRRKKKRTTSDNRLAPATVAKRIHVARRVFGKAKTWGWITENPFGHLRAGSQSNPSRNHYVDVQVTEAVLAACAGLQWQALVGLCRYAGLRCPSEVGLLRWADVDFHHGRLQVRSPKTEGHGGEHAVRLVPMVPRLRAILGEVFDAAPAGESIVVPMAARAQANLRTTLTKVIERAHCQPWPRLFQNLRASCETDWAQTYPAHVCAKWLGHSPRIAQDHYLMVRDHHFQDAASGGTEEASDRGAKSGALVAQNAAQQSSATDRDETQDESETELYPAEYVVSATSIEEGKKVLVGDEGLEPPTPSV